MATKDYSSKQEKSIAKYLGWSTVSGSGARPCHPGDIIGDEWLGECKTHVSRDNSIFFSFDVWKKICDEAIFQHRNPVLFTDDGSQNLDKTWCIFNHFHVNSDWKCRPLQKKFRTNITMTHEDLSKLYSVDDIINQVSEPVCYLAEFNHTKVAILPLRLFKYMFD